jgi:hypothetical protein
MEFDAFMAIAVSYKHQDATGTPKIYIHHHRDVLEVFRNAALANFNNPISWSAAILKKPLR